MSPTAEVQVVRQHFPDRAVEHFRHTQRFILNHKYPVEVINQPRVNAIDQDHIQHMKDELWEVLLGSCETPEHKRDDYLRKVNILKMTIDVDVLVVMRDEGRVIGFVSGSYLDSDVFYVNGAMILPKYQEAGLGGLLIVFLIFTVMELSRRRGILKTYAVCRTQNRNVASILLHGSLDGQISTEVDSLYKTNQLIIEKTVEYLHCPYNPHTGLSAGVLPEGVPQGKEIRDDRINRAFRAVGPSDACYVAGQVNYDFVLKILRNKIELLTYA